MLLLPILVGCGGAKDDVTFPEEFIADYASWNQPDGWSGPAISCDGTHGPMVDVWYNAEAEATVTAGSGPFADGAALVKAGYKDDGTVNTLTAMVKQEGANPDGADWLWAQLDADLALQQGGALGGCSGCHSAAAMDYVLFPESPVVADASECP